MAYIIRSYKASDLDFMLESHRTMYAAEYGYKDSFFIYAGKTITDFLDATKWERENIWIAETDGRPVGVIALICPEPENPFVGQVRWFLVRCECRKSGIGSALMNRLLESAAAWQYRQLFLWTASNLDSALAFYKRCGFSETQRHERRDWCDQMIYELKMARDVSPAPPED